MLQRMNFISDLRNIYQKYIYAFYLMLIHMFYLFFYILQVPSNGAL